jgi:hypothetical protein
MRRFQTTIQIWRNILTIKTEFPDAQQWELLKTVNFTEEFLSLIQEDSEDWRSLPPASWRLDRCAPGSFK